MNKDFKHNLYVILLDISLGIAGISIEFLIVGIVKSNKLMIILSLITLILIIPLIIFIMVTRPYRHKKKKKATKKKGDPSKK